MDAGFGGFLAAFFATNVTVTSQDAVGLAALAIGVATLNIQGPRFVRAGGRASSCYEQWEEQTQQYFADTVHGQHNGRGLDALSFRPISTEMSWSLGRIDQHAEA